MNFDIRIELVDKFSIAQGFVHASREGPPDHPESKRTLRELESFARDHGGTVDNSRKSERSKPRNAKFYDLATASNIVETAFFAFGSAGGAVALLKTSRDIFLKWLDLSTRHEIKVTVGDVSIEMKGQKKSLDDVIATIQRLEAERAAKQLILPENGEKRES